MQTSRRERPRRKGLWLGLAAFTLVLGSATGAVAFQAGGSPKAQAVVPPRQVAPALPTVQKPFLLGHKGSINSAVRNTVPAMNAAFDQGADGIEFDIVRTSDNRIVILSDPSLTKSTRNCTGVTSEHTYAEVLKCKTLDGARIPTLEEGLRVVQEHDGRLMLHTKISPNAAIAEDIVEALEKFGLNDPARTTVFGSHKEMLDMLKADGAKRVGLIFQDPYKKAGWAANYDVLIPFRTKATPELVKAARARGVAVVLVEGPWAPLTEALALNVDGLILDSIVEARAAIG